MWITSGAQYSPPKLGILLAIQAGGVLKTGAGPADQFSMSVELKNPSWTDLGIVVQSYGGGAEINAIDPSLFRDYDGKVYMSYGLSFLWIGQFLINIGVNVGLLPTKGLTFQGSCSCPMYNNCKHVVAWLISVTPMPPKNEPYDM